MCAYLIRRNSSLTLQQQVCGRRLPTAHEFAETIVIITTTTIFITAMTFLSIRTHSHQHRYSTISFSLYTHTLAPPDIHHHTIVTMYIRSHPDSSIIPTFPPIFS
ncbi:hypothetical protein LXL04_028158 [Taraxacum kok-saghyz]